jgi:hypothetical protein
MSGVFPASIRSFRALVLVSSVPGRVRSWTLGVEPRQQPTPRLSEVDGGGEDKRMDEAVQMKKRKQEEVGNNDVGYWYNKLLFRKVLPQLLLFLKGFSKVRIADEVHDRVDGRVTKSQPDACYHGRG